MDIKIGQEFNIYEGDKRVATRVPVAKVLKTRIVLEGGRKFRTKATKHRESGSRRRGTYRVERGMPALSEIDGPGWVEDSDKEEIQELWETFSETCNKISARFRSSTLPDRRAITRALEAWEGSLSELVKELNS
jgi:hypothetical protein